MYSKQKKVKCIQTLVPLSRKRFSFLSGCFDHRGLADGTLRAKAFASVAAQIEDGKQA